MSVNGTINLKHNPDPDNASDSHGRIFWDNINKVVKQIDEEGNIKVLAGTAGWGSIAGNLSDQSDLYGKIRNQVTIKSIADLNPYLVGTSYELPSGRYIIDTSINIGTNNISLVDSAFYIIDFSSLNSITYTGTGPLINMTTAGSALKMTDGFLIGPNCSELFLCQDINSLILTLVVCSGKKVATVTNAQFITLNDLPMIGCADGWDCINCGTITAKVLQWNGGLDTGGNALKISGANSDRLMISICDARPESTESYLYIDSSYGGQVSISGGVFEKSLGGKFFNSSGKDGTEPKILVQNITNVQNSKATFFSHLTNTIETVINAIDTPVRINAGSGWSDVARERFDFDANGIWTYKGIEDISLSISLMVTLDPVGGGTKGVSTYFAKNGTVLLNTKAYTTASSGTQITCSANINLSTNDYLECFIENNTDTSNLIAQVGSIKIP